MRTPSRLPRCGTQARAVDPSKHELIRLIYLTRLHAAVPTFMASGVCWCRKARTAVQMASTGQKKKPSSRKLSVPFSPAVAKTAMAAKPTIAKARKTTNFIESYSGCYGVDGMAPLLIAMPLPRGGTWPDV